MTKHPLLTGQSFFSGERAARIASTKANYLYAENIFKNASRNIWDDYENTVSKITEEFNEAAASYNSQNEPWRVRSYSASGRASRKCYTIRHADNLCRTGTPHRPLSLE